MLFSCQIFRLYSVFFVDAHMNHVHRFQFGTRFLLSAQGTPLAFLHNCGKQFSDISAPATHSPEDMRDSGAQQPFTQVTAAHVAEIWSEKGFVFAGDQLELIEF